MTGGIHEPMSRPPREVVHPPPKETNMLNVGLDLHERTSSICFLDNRGEIMGRETIRGHPRRVVERFRELGTEMRVCFEASTNYGWMHDELTAIGAEVLVAHPGKLRLIFRSKRKNDRLDAERLAKLLYLNEVPTIHVPSINVRAWRKLIENRKRVVSTRSRTKNALRAMLRSHGIEAPSRQRLWSKKGLEWLCEVDLPNGVAMLERDQALEDLEHFARKIQRIEQELTKFARGHPWIALLQTIPGVGIRTAEAFVAYIDDPNRFGPKSIGAYLGIVPSQDASAGVNRLGRITRDGPGTLRGLLTEAAWQAIRRSPTVKAVFNRLCREDKTRRKKALVATSHYLARVMLAMLRSEEAWREEERLAA
jgi:transposase